MSDPPLNFPLNSDTNAICQFESETGLAKTIVKEVIFGFKPICLLPIANYYLYYLYLYYYLLPIIAYLQIAYCQNPYHIFM